MLKPRRENSDATRASTPGLSSTSTDSVCVGIDPLVAISIFRSSRKRSYGASRSSRKRSSRMTFFWIVEQRADPAGGLDLVVAGACGDHRPHLGVGADDEIDH